MSLKRKQVNVPLEIKLNALKRLDDGERLKSVAAELGVSNVTLGDWRRNRKKLECYTSEHAPTCAQRKSMKSSYFKDVCEALFVWYNQQLDEGHQASGADLQHKAKLLSRQFYGEGRPFSASAGWLARWKKRYGIRLSNKSNIDLESNLQIIMHESIDEQTETKRVLRHSDGMAALELALQYVEEQPEATPEDILLFKKWRDIAARKRK